jgi:hypothetical protein
MIPKPLAQRAVSRIWHVPVQPGSRANHRIGQVLAPGHWREFDPFLLMMEDWFVEGTFPFHPHRGMETVTFILEGRLRHEDNHGGKGVLNPGDVQWMTAGRGIIHAEDPMPGETVHSLQLWVNLPKSKKMTEPRYQDLPADQMPVRQVEGGLVRIFSGSSGGVFAPTLNHVPVTYVEIVLEAGAEVCQDLPGEYNGFIYILEGRGRFGRDLIRGEARQVLWLDTAEQDHLSEVKICADERLRALLIAGKPIGEPVVAGGPFVMNTREEIKQAYEDYLKGKFGKV